MSNMDNTALQPVLDALLDALADRVAGKLGQQAGQKELYTVQDLCERYNVSDDTITRWMRAGEFGETVNPTPRIHLVTLSGITEFDARHTGPAYAGQPVLPAKRRARGNPGPI